MGMGTHAGGQTSRESLVWGKEISCLKERGDLVQANMPNNLWRHESVALQGEPMRFMWCTGGQRAELQPDPQKLNVSCISGAEKGGGGLLQAGHSWPGTHRGTAGSCPPTDSVIWEQRGLRLLLLDANLTHLARGNFSRDIASISLARGHACGVGGIFLIADRCGRPWPGCHWKGG